MRNIYYQILSLFSFIINNVFRNRLRVLAYHDVKNIETFAKQIHYLKSNYNIISINELKKHCSEKSPLPKKSLLLTFDDGDISVLKHGLPVLKNYNCAACAFIITELINTDLDFWWERIYKNDKINNKKFSESLEKVSLLKQVSNRERIEALRKYPITYKEQLSTGDLHYLIDKNIFVGNHSHTHPMFDKCTISEIQRELINSRECFDKLKIDGFNIFAYPNGNYDENSEKILKENNITMAFLFDHKINSPEINPMRISRIRTNSDMSLNELKVKVSGLHSLLYNWK